MTNTVHPSTSHYTEKRHHLYSFLQRGVQLITMVSMMLLIGLSAPAQQVYEANRDTSHKYDTLFISPSGGGNQFCAYTSADTNSDGRVHKTGNAKKTIEWAIGNARLTVLTEGEYVVGQESQAGIKITEDNVSLVVGPEATLAGTGNPDYPIMIQVYMADNVNVFNLGTIDTRNDKGLAVRYEGHHGEKGTSGAKGGILFGSGRIKNNNAGYWAVDTEGMTWPLIWSEQHMNAPVAMEGVENSELGVIGQLALGEGQGEGEAIDLNMSCKRMDLGHVIGLAPRPGDEIVDINNGHYVTVDRLTAFQGAGYDGALLVGYDRYGHSGMFSKRPKLNRQKGHNIKWTERIRKDVADFKRTVSFPDYPQSLPTLNVHARLIVEFEDGSTWELVNKKYRFDL